MFHVHLSSRGTNIHTAKFRIAVICCKNAESCGKEIYFFIFAATVHRTMEAEMKHSLKALIHPRNVIIICNHKQVYNLSIQIWLYLDTKMYSFNKYKRRHN